MSNIIVNQFVVENIETTKTFLRLGLTRDEKKYIGIVKDNVDLCLNTLKINDTILCKYKVKKTKGNEYFEIAHLRLLNSENLDAPEGSKSIPKQEKDEYIDKFNKLVLMVQDIDFKAILIEVFNEDVKELFYSCVGAKDNHHNQSGGLLQHTVETTQIALFLANYCKNVNIDLLITGSLLHDIGKLKSYEQEPDQNIIKKTDWEFLLGHLSMSTIFVSKVIPSNIDAKKAMILYHLLLSHHGSKQNGSPVNAQMIESFILSQSDYLSAYLNHIGNLNVNSSGWTNIDKLTNMCWFRDMKQE